MRDPKARLLIALLIVLGTLTWIARSLSPASRSGEAARAGVSRGVDRARSPLPARETLILRADRIGAARNADPELPKRDPFFQKKAVVEKRPVDPGSGTPPPVAVKPPIVKTPPKAAPTLPPAQTPRTPALAGYKVLGFRTTAARGGPETRRVFLDRGGRVFIASVGDALEETVTISAMDRRSVTLSDAASGMTREILFR